MRTRLATALSLALAACSSSSQPAPQVAEVTPTRPSPSATAPHNKVTEVADKPPARGGAIACRREGLPAPFWAADDAAVGAVDAPLVMLWFLDLDDPFTMRVAPTVHQLRSELGEGQLRIVLKHNPLPFHHTAALAAKAADVVNTRAGGDVLLRFVSMTLEKRPPHDLPRLMQTARTAGVADLTDFEQATEGPAVAARIADHQALANALDLRGTPSFMLNGIPLIGAQPIDRFREVAREAMLQTPRDPCNAFVAAQLPPPPPPPVPQAPQPPVVVAVPLGKAPARGGASALVTIVMFGGYQDPFSRRIEPTLEALLKKYGDDLRVVFRHSPLDFHTMARKTAGLAASAHARGGNALFWKVHHALMEASPLDDRSVGAIASKHGLAFPARREADRAVNDDAALSKGAGVVGTPSFFINGRKLIGAQPQQAFEGVIDEEMARAKRLMAAGTSRQGVYEAALKDQGAQPIQAIP